MSAPEPALHEFIEQNHAEILEVCLQKIRSRSPKRFDEAALRPVFATLIDEIARGLQKEAGLPVSSPMPGPSEAAATHGAVSQREGVSVGDVAMQLGMISDSVGEVAAKRGLRFAAREYQLFDKSIDTSICASIERFTSRAREQHDARASERVGVIAHELRNALAGARLAYAMLRRGNVGVASRTGDLLARNLSRMTELIDPLFLALRLNAGESTEGQRVRLGPVLREVQESTVPERDIVVVVDANDALEVRGDARVLGAAIGHLVQTAVKLSENGALVFVRARPEPGGGASVEVESGCVGLPERDEELFAPLGPSIAREAVEALGGAIGVRRPAENACVLWIRLPP